MPPTNPSDPGRPVAAPLPETGLSAGDPALLTQHALTPWQALATLYAEGADDLTEALITSLSREVFDAELPQPSSRLRRKVAKYVFRLLKRTTRTEIKILPDGHEIMIRRNPILERMRNPYARTMLDPTAVTETAAFVEGGDSMNAVYMMLSPEIRNHASTGDRIFLDSVQGKDAQLRFVWESRLTFQLAEERLSRGEPVRLKAVAAGTGLSMVLVYDRLIRSGYDPGLITVTITDVDPGHTAKTGRLLKKLVSTRDHFIPDGNSHDPGIFVKTEDVLHMTPLSAAASVDKPYHILTLVGILEYFCGFTASTTEGHFGLPTIGEENEAVDLIRNVYAMTADSGALIANSYRFEIGARILEIFGKRFRYRDRNDLEALVQTAGFTTTGIVGSGLMYDVEIFRKPPASQKPATSG